jgi:predicted HAD superfamily Cof-like phosphohydrolase
MEMLDQVAEFRRAIGGQVASRPALDVPYRDLHVALVREEVDELAAAVESGDLVEAADALADILYVTFEAALAFGIPIEEVFGEVHRANMAKVGSAGETVTRADGKVVAPPGWQRPDVARILARHGAVLDARSSSDSAVADVGRVDPPGSARNGAEV